MKKLLTLAIWAILVIPANAQLLRSSPQYTGKGGPLTLPVGQFDEYNVTLTANTPIVFSIPTIPPGTQEFRINTCQNSTGGWTPTFSAPAGLTIVNRVGAVVTTLAALACDTEYWTYRAISSQLVLESVSFNSFGAPATLNVTAFGASGSLASITCTADGSTAVVTGCSSLAGWAAGPNNYAFVIGGGTANALSTPAAPTVTNSCAGSCTTPATNYAYEVSACKVNSDGISCTPASAAGSVSAVAALFPGSSNIEKNVLSAYTVTGATYYEIYRSINSGDFNKLDETSSSTYSDFGQPGADQTTITLDDSATAPIAARAATLNARVVSINSPTSMTLSIVPTQSGSLTIYHDDSFAIRATVAAAAAAGGGTVSFPSGTFPVAPSKIAVGFGTQNSVINLQGLSNSNIIIRGQGPLATKLKVVTYTTANFNGNPSVVFQIDGALSSGGLASALTTTAIQAPLLAGSGSIPVASVSGMAVGDYVLVRTGQNDIAAVVNPTAENNRITSIDATANTIGLQWGLSHDYKQEYFETGITGVTQQAPLWATGTYILNQIITCATNCPGAVSTIFRATTVTLGGNTGASEPNWNGSCPAATNTCTDGNVTWTNVNPSTTQAAIFGIGDYGSNLIHDIQIRDLSVEAPQGGTQSTSGVRLFLINQTDRVLIDNVVANVGDIGAVGYNHATTLTNNYFVYNRMNGGSSACCGANGTTDWIWDKNTVYGNQGFGMQEGEGVAHVRFTNSTFINAFPAFNNLATTTLFGSSTGPFDFLFANNLVCGHPGAGIVTFTGTGAGKPAQQVSIYGNIFECPWGSSIPDAQARNKGGSTIILQDQGSGNIGPNSFIPANAWDGFTTTGVLGFGFSSTGNRQNPFHCTGTLRFSQAAGTTAVPLCTLPANSMIDWCALNVTTAFNAATTNSISIGGSVTATTYLSSVSFGTSIATGLNLWDYTTGRGIGNGATNTLNAAARNITTSGGQNSANNLTAYYSFTGTAPTTGVGEFDCQVHQWGQ